MRVWGALTLLLFVLFASAACQSVDTSLAEDLTRNVLAPLEAAHQAGDETERLRQCTAFEMALEAPDVKKQLAGEGAATKAVVEKLRAACQGVDTGVGKRR